MSRNERDIQKTAARETTSTAGEPAPVYTGKHFTGLFCEPNAFSAAKHFVFFICPILLKLGMEENDPSTKWSVEKEKMFLGIWPSSILNDN